jgi:hypothetical protein
VPRAGIHKTSRSWSSNGMVVGGRREVEEAAAQWRMVPRGFTKYFYNPDPRAIEADAERTIPLESVVRRRAAHGGAD